jgi:hypothetical protein
MLKRAIDWLLYKLRIKEKKHVDAVLSVMSLLGLLITITAVMYMAKHLGLLPKLSWYRRLWYKSRWYLRWARTVLIGY